MIPSPAAGVLLAIALALVGCSDGPAGPTGGTDDAACGPVEHPPQQPGQHLIGGHEPPVSYSSTPPTSGWHASGTAPFGVHERELPEPQQVNVLEEGGVVVTHRGLDPENRQRLADLVEDQFTGRAAVAPYPKLGPGEVALAAWGVLQRCKGLDLHAVASFIDEHAAEKLRQEH